MEIKENKKSLIDMNKKVYELEERLGRRLPKLYKKFLVEEIKEEECYEIMNKREEYVCLYNYSYLEERNETYDIKSFEPDYFMIGQDGDVGYYINLKLGKENIYSLDLGALGSLELYEEEKTIYLLGKKVSNN